ncbi:MAG: DUF5666 domain-containing protein [Thiohalomonadaceae bacterium]
MRTGMVIGLALLAAILGACNGGGQMAGGGTGGTGMVAVRGQVASTETNTTVAGVKALAGVTEPGVNTIEINGITYDMSAVDYDGTRSIEAGMVVTLVAGTNANGTRTAESAFYMGELTGPVKGALATNVFEMMGHTVFWDDRTQFSGMPKDNPSAGVWVEISGFSMDDGRIHATYVTYADGTAAEAVGYVTSTAGALVLNKVLTVEDQDPDFDSANVRQYQVLKVRGTYSEATRTIVATEIQTLPNMGDLGNGDEEAEVEGLVTGAPALVTTSSTFFVAGQPVRLTPSTEVSGGLLGDIANGAHVEVEGPLVQTDGVYYIDAEEIEFADAIEIEARFDDYDPATRTLSFFGGWITVQLVDGTQVSTSLDLDRDVCVDVRARKANGTAELVASQVKPESGCGSEAELQVPVEAIDRDRLTFTMLGREISTSGLDLKDEDKPGNLSRSDFFDLLKVGDLVSLEGSPVPNGIPSWHEAEIER